jgi:hypothetical protein
MSSIDYAIGGPGKIDAIGKGITTESTVYKVGDKGPSGGYVFYDKGNSKDGWQYLETAPDEYEQKAIQSKTQIVMSEREFSNDLGGGLNNTKVIVDELSKHPDETIRAAQICAGHTIGGHNDWYLPTLKELQLMFNSLKKNGIDRFRDDAYWSSLYLPNQPIPKYYQVDFKTGRTQEMAWGHNAWVRSIRRF